MFRGCVDSEPGRSKHYCCESGRFNRPAVNRTLVNLTAVNLTAVNLTALDLTVERT